ncbi:MAG: hypothetical protein ACREOK_00365 [Gemmatimonadaceae bacterium]
MPQRLNRSLQRALGAEAAEDLVSLLDGVELQRSELRAFREGMRADFAEFRGELERQTGALRQEMTASLASMRHEMTTSLASMRHDMTAAHGVLGERITGVESRLMKWSLVFWTGAVLAIAGLVVAMR